MHLLVWLTNFSHIQYRHIRADIPPSTDALSEYVLRHQRSDKASNSLSIQDVPTYVDEHHDTQLLHVIHPASAFATNLHAYIDTVLPSLCCSMDVQTSDGRGMVLRYVTSYVAKWTESFHKDSLFVSDVNASHAAFRYLVNLKLCEPEMWTLLSDTKLSYCYGTTVQFVAPYPQSIEDHTVVQQYYRRPHSHIHLSLLEWLRVHNTTAKKSRSASLPVFIGIKFLSLFNPIFFFQMLLVYFPHTTHTAILPDHHSQIFLPRLYISTKLCNISHTCCFLLSFKACLNQRDINLHIYPLPYPT